MRPGSIRSASPSALLIIIAACGLQNPLSAETLTIRAEVWADNWYAIYVDDKLLMEDSTPYNTERSFNADTQIFELELPARLNVIMKDFKENDTGLEYIGSPRQQIGDGGFAAQFFDNDSDKLIAVSNGEWRCHVVHRAPLNRSCVRSTNPETDCGSEVSDAPENWKSPEFDDSGWARATEHTAETVRPHGGYREIDWHADVKLIWSADVEIDNTVLCRTEIRK